MLKSCKYCGRIHDSKFDCGKKPPRWSKKRTDTVAYKVHGSNRWRKMSEEIRDRDGYLCQVCLTGKYGTINRLNSDGVSVHHIIPIEEDPSLAYDDSNLITLCAKHHEMAESGEISRSELFSLINPDGESTPRGSDA